MSVECSIYHTKVTVSVFDEVALEEGYAPLTKILKYTLSNGVMEVDVIDFGATITAIRVPDKDGNLADVVLGYDSMKGYMATKNNPYFGATIGRVANRIANGKFTLDKITHVLSKNEGENTLHGGVLGFNRKLWQGCINEEGLLLQMTSPHLEQGFPGELKVKAKFILTTSNDLVIKYKATTDRPTIINMTSHGYFNLAGHDSGAEKLYEHNLMINANNFTPNDDNNIPKGKIQDVLDSVLDFTAPKNIGQAIEGTGDANGFDINFIVNGLTEKRLVACLEHPGSGRRMTMHSNQPGVQLYTGNCVDVNEGEGKGGVAYSRHAALCLEPQNYPNAINEKHFPSCILRPPDSYNHIISYQFTTYNYEEEEALKKSQQRWSSLRDSDEVDYDEILGTKSIAAPEESNVSEKSDKKECQNKVNPKTDSPECLKGDVYPDFRTGAKFDNCALQYEPLSSIFPSEQELNQKIPFETELRQCRNLINSKGISTRFSTLRNCQYNIVADTDIMPSTQPY